MNLKNISKLKVKWIPEVISRLQSGIGTGNIQQLKNAMLLLVKVAHPTVTNCITNKKTTKATRLGSCLKSFLTHFGLKLSQLKEIMISPSYEDLATTLLSYILDLKLMTALEKKQNIINEEIKDICQDLFLFLGSNTSSFWDVILQSTILKKPTKIMIPLFEQLLRRGPTRVRTPEEYMKFLLVVRLYNKATSKPKPKCKMAAETFLIKPPKMFFKWLSSLSIQLPETLRLKQTKLNQRKLIEIFTGETITPKMIRKIQNALSEDIYNFEDDQNVPEEAGPVDSQSNDNLFFVDKGPIEIDQNDENNDGEITSSKYNKLKIKIDEFPSKIKTPFIASVNDSESENEQLEHSKNNAPKRKGDQISPRKGAKNARRKKRRNVFSVVPKEHILDVDENELNINSSQEDQEEEEEEDINVEPNNKNSVEFRVSQFIRNIRNESNTEKDCRKTVHFEERDYCQNTSESENEPDGLNITLLAKEIKRKNSEPLAAAAVKTNLQPKRKKKAKKRDPEIEKKELNPVLSISEAGPPSSSSVSISVDSKTKRKQKKNARRKARRLLQKMKDLIEPENEIIEEPLVVVEKEETVNKIRKTQKIKDVKSPKKLQIKASQIPTPLSLNSSFSFRKSSQDCGSLNRSTSRFTISPLNKKRASSNDKRIAGRELFKETKMWKRSPLVKETFSPLKERRELFEKTPAKKKQLKTSEIELKANEKPQNIDNSMKENIVPSSPIVSCHSSVDGQYSTANKEFENDSVSTSSVKETNLPTKKLVPVKLVVSLSSLLSSLESKDSDIAKDSQIESPSKIYRGVMTSPDKKNTRTEALTDFESPNVSNLSLRLEDSDESSCSVKKQFLPSSASIDCVTLSSDSEEETPSKETKDNRLTSTIVTRIKVSNSPNKNSDLGGVNRQNNSPCKLNLSQKVSNEKSDFETITFSDSGDEKEEEEPKKIQLSNETASQINIFDKKEDNGTSKSLINDQSEIVGSGNILTPSTSPDHLSDQEHSPSKKSALEELVFKSPAEKISPSKQFCLEIPLERSPLKEPQESPSKEEKIPIVKQSPLKEPQRPVNKVSPSKEEQSQLVRQIESPSKEAPNPVLQSPLKELQRPLVEEESTSKEAQNPVPQSPVKEAQSPVLQESPLEEVSSPAKQSPEALEAIEESPSKEVTSPDEQLVLIKSPTEPPSAVGASPLKEFSSKIPLVNDSPLSSNVSSTLAKGKSPLKELSFKSSPVETVSSSPSLEGQMILRSIKKQKNISSVSKPDKKCEESLPIRVTRSSTKNLLGKPLPSETLLIDLEVANETSKISEQSPTQSELVAEDTKDITVDPEISEKVNLITKPTEKSLPISVTVEEKEGEEEESPQLSPTLFNTQSQSTILSTFDDSIMTIEMPLETSPLVKDVSQKTFPVENIDSELTLNSIKMVESSLEMRVSPPPRQEEDEEKVGHDSSTDIDASSGALEISFEIDNSPKKLENSPKKIETNLKKVASSPGEIFVSLERLSFLEKVDSFSPKKVVFSSPEKVVSSPEKMETSLLKNADSSPKKVEISPQKTESSSAKKDPSPRKVQSSSPEKISPKKVESSSSPVIAKETLQENSSSKPIVEVVQKKIEVLSCASVGEDDFPYRVLRSNSRLSLRSTTLHSLKSSASKSKTPRKSFLKVYPKLSMDEEIPKSDSTSDKEDTLKTLPSTRPSEDLLMKSPEINRDVQNQLEDILNMVTPETPLKLQETSDHIPDKQDEASVVAPVEEAAEKPVEDAEEEAAKEAVEDAEEEAAKEAVEDIVMEEVKDAVEDVIEEVEEDIVMEEVEDAVEDLIEEEVEDAVEEAERQSTISSNSTKLVGDEECATSNSFETSSEDPDERFSYSQPKGKFNLKKQIGPTSSSSCSSSPNEWFLRKRPPYKSSPKPFSKKPISVCHKLVAPPFVETSLLSSSSFVKESSIYDKDFFNLRSDVSSSDVEENEKLSQCSSSSTNVIKRRIGRTTTSSSSYSYSSLSSSSSSFEMVKGKQRKTKRTSRFESGCSKSTGNKTSRSGQKNVDPEISYARRLLIDSIIKENRVESLVSSDEEDENDTEPYGSDTNKDINSKAPNLVYPDSDEEYSSTSTVPIEGEEEARADEFFSEVSNPSTVPLPSTTNEELHNNSKARNVVLPDSDEEYSSSSTVPIEGEDEARTEKFLSEVTNPSTVPPPSTTTNDEESNATASSITGESPKSLKGLQSNTPSILTRQLSLLTLKVIAKPLNRGDIPFSASYSPPIANRTRITHRKDDSTINDDDNDDEEGDSSLNKSTSEIGVQTVLKAKHIDMLAPRISSKKSIKASAKKRNSSSGKKSCPSELDKNSKSGKSLRRRLNSPSSSSSLRPGLRNSPSPTKGATNLSENSQNDEEFLQDPISQASEEAAAASASGSSIAYNLRSRIKTPSRKLFPQTPEWK